MKIHFFLINLIKKEHTLFYNLEFKIRKIVSMHMNISAAALKAFSILSLQHTEPAEMILKSLKSLV